MAGLNQIQGGRWDGFLRRIFPIKERSIAPVLAPELVGYVTVQEWEDDLFWARDERLAWADIRLAGVASQFAHAQLLNPAGSDALVILEKIFVDTSSTGVVSIAALTGALPSGVRAASSPRDQRFQAIPSIGATVAQPITVSNVALLGSASNAEVITGDLFTHEFKLGTILPPGESVVIRNTQVNKILGVTWFWRERTAEGTELVSP